MRSANCAICAQNAQTSSFDVRKLRVLGSNSARNFSQRSAWIRSVKSPDLQRCSSITHAVYYCQKVKALQFVSILYNYALHYKFLNTTQLCSTSSTTLGGRENYFFSLGTRYPSNTTEKCHNWNCLGLLLSNSKLVRLLQQQSVVLFVILFWNM